ncbi:MAG: hypothetical protein PUP92_14075 [Rhizonema sp. PD38]|nr:hypothetical protein [Rhizonema sp. PD38]
MTIDLERNKQVINCSGRISSDDSSLHAYVIPVEEGLMIAQEAIHCLHSQKTPKEKHQQKAGLDNNRQTKVD